VKERLTTASPRPGFPVTDCVANGRAFQEQRKEGREDEIEREHRLRSSEMGQSQVLTPVLDFQTSFGSWPGSLKVSVNTWL